MNGRVSDMARRAREASYALRACAPGQRNEALRALGVLLSERAPEILEANREDVRRAEAEGMKEAPLARLHLDGKKLVGLRDGLSALAALPDPVGVRQIRRELADGLVLTRVSCPIGVVAVIFESRPDALIQIGSLCLKSANCVLLKGGREAAETNAVLFALLQEAGRSAGLPEGWAGLLASREDVTALLALDQDVDLVIPRGSGAFVRYIMEHTNIPVLGHSEGICHLYLDAGCDPQMAARLAVDAKCQYPSACNAIETLLWHRDAEEALLSAARALSDKGVRLLADKATLDLLSGSSVPCEPAGEDAFGTEYLSLALNLARVDNVEEAIAHINRWGSHHTDAIVTESDESWRRFSGTVDSAGVYRNCSTRFADGYRYGFGAEVGIATGRLHARGPMGLEGLCSYTYRLEGKGDTVGEFASGKRAFTHRDLPLA